MKIAESLIELVGNTPMVKLNKLNTGRNCSKIRIF